MKTSKIEEGTMARRRMPRIGRSRAILAAAAVVCAFWLASTGIALLSGLLGMPSTAHAQGIPNDLQFTPRDAAEEFIGQGRTREERGQSVYESQTERRLDQIERRQGTSERLREEQRMRREYHDDKSRR